MPVNRSNPDGARARCEQTVHVVAIEWIALMASISKGQMHGWLRTFPSTLELYSAPGIVISRSGEPPAEVPRFPCKTCGDFQPLHGLFGGACRRCAGPDQKEA